jgi:hypothetical protein
MGLVSTAEEAARLAGALLTPGRLLHRPLREHLDSATFAVHELLPRQCPFLIRVELAGHQVFWHDGFDGGFSAAMYLVPAADLAVVLLTNGPTWRLGEDLGPRVLATLLGGAAVPVDAVPVGDTRPAGRPQRKLCGRYRHPAGHPLEPRPPDVLVRSAEGALWLSVPLAGQRIRLMPEGSNPLVFVLEGGARRRRAVFVTDRAGRVTGLCIDGLVPLPRRRRPTAAAWHAHRALRGLAGRFAEKGRA